MRWQRAPAKVNLTLHVVGRRIDGLHEIESLVAFGGVCDWLGFEPGPRLDLEIEGQNALGAGPMEANLVLRAAQELADRVPGLLLGRFRLTKQLPIAGGLGGGSADAAAALRALATANDLALGDERVRAAATATGADVPVCLHSRARVMTGKGERLGPLVSLPSIFAILVNPRVAVSTRQVFEGLGLAPGSQVTPSEHLLSPKQDASTSLDSIASSRNDLESSALHVAPVIADVLDALSGLPAVKTSRMSGSGATCFALFDDGISAAFARKSIASDRPGWWVKGTRLR